MKQLIVLVGIATSLSAPVLSETKRDLDSHEHGAALLNIALDRGAVFLELETPWNNLVGFEHAPNTEEQHALVDDALARLNDPAQLFSFDGGGCEPDEVVIQSSIDSHDDEHDEEHDEEHHDDHDDEKSSHSEVLATYSFSCDDVAAIAGIDVALLKLWGGFEKLDVQLIGPGGQNLEVLDPNSTTVDMAPVQ